MGLPAVAAGFLVVDGGGLLTTSYEYGFAVMALALAALTAVVRRTTPAVVPGPAVAARELCGQSAR
jgi:hypothetical protein